MDLDSPDYGGGAVYACHCNGTKRQYRQPGGGRYIGGGRYSAGPDTDEPAPDLPAGYYGQRAEALRAEARAMHAADCNCMLCSTQKDPND